MAVDKRAGFGLEVKSIAGKSGKTYIIFKTKAGSFHVFQEIQAKDAAQDCGAQTKGRTTRQAWQEIWERQ